MAKKTAAEAAPDEGPKANALVIRGSASWREWLVDYAVKKRTTQAGLVDMALAEMAMRDGFRTPPKR